MLLTISVVLSHQFSTQATVTVVLQIIANEI